MVKTADKNKGLVVLDLGTLLDKMNFENFSELKKEAYKLVKDYREYFVKIVLNQRKIPYEINMSKKEKMELFEKHIVGIIKDEKRNYDKIYMEGNLIAYWNRNYELTFKNGRLLCKINFKVY